MDFAYCRLIDARQLVAAVADCGASVPERLTALMDGYDALQSADTNSTNPLDALVKAFSTGKSMATAARDKAIRDAWTAQGCAEFRAGLQQRVEPALIRQFGRALENGCAQDIITALSPAFDEAAAKLAECAKLVDPNVDPEVFIANADADSLHAWKSIDEHVSVCTKISSVVGQFGPMSTTFKLIEQPVNLPGSGFLDNNGLMCTAPEYDIEEACAAFRRVRGTHRNSPWFRLAPVLKLCGIDDARERVRAWSQKAWDGLGLNQGRGRMDPKLGFIAEPIKNPFAKQTADA